MRWEHAGDIKRDTILTTHKNTHMHGLKNYLQLRDTKSQVFSYTLPQHLLVTPVAQRILKKKQIRIMLSGVRQVVVCIHSSTRLENCLHMFMSSLSEYVFNQRSNDYHFQIVNQSVYQTRLANYYNKQPPTLWLSTVQIYFSLFFSLMWGEGLCSTQSVRDPGFSDTADFTISQDLSILHWFLPPPLSGKETTMELVVKFGSDRHHPHPHIVT